MITDLIVFDDKGTSFDASEFVTSLSVSLTADAISQLTIRLEDPFLDMMNKNVWQIRRKLRYLGTRYEVAAIEILQSSAREGLVIEARSEGCQRLKRDKGQASFGAISPTAFAKLKADEFGLRFFGESTPAKKTIIRAQNDKVDESSWTVLKRLADEYEFLLFETENTLFFASESFLLGKFAAVAAATNEGFLPDEGTIIPTSTSRTKAGRKVPIPVVPGNIYLQTRRPVLLPDGEIATIRSISFEDDNGLEVVIPTIGPNGQDWDDDTAVDYYFETGQHLGKLRTPEDAVIYSTWLSEMEALRIAEDSTAPSRFRSVPIHWISDVPSNQFGFKAIECPTVRTSDDRTTVATLGLQLERDDGKLLRPGMTVTLVDIPQFNKNYIVTEVRWEEGATSSISVAGRTPEKIKDSDLQGGTFNTTILTRTI
jgi:hypothetical protein